MQWGGQQKVVAEYSVRYLKERSHLFYKLTFERGYTNTRGIRLVGTVLVKRGIVLVVWVHDR